MKRYDVTALGELLIDFTENGKSPQGNPLFEANPGGAPCNVLAMLAKLGHRTAFIGKVGNDFWGYSLKLVSKKSELIRHFYAWMTKYILRWHLYILPRMETEIFLFTGIRGRI